MVRESLESTQEMPFLDTKWLFFLLIGPDQILESLDSKSKIENRSSNLSFSEADFIV